VCAASRTRPGAPVEPSRALERLRHEMSIIPLAIAAGLLVSASTGVQPPTPATGTIVAQVPCAFTNEEASASRGATTRVTSTRAPSPIPPLNVCGFSTRATGSRSSGSWSGRARTAKYPVIVYNRGGFRDIGKIDSWNLIDFYGFAS
jgi:hypothetical protein